MFEETRTQTSQETPIGSLEIRQTQALPLWAQEDWKAWVQEKARRETSLPPPSSCRRVLSVGVRNDREKSAKRKEE